MRGEREKSVLPGDSREGIKDNNPILQWQKLASEIRKNLLTVRVSDTVQIMRMTCFFPHKDYIQKTNLSRL